MIPVKTSIHPKNELPRRKQQGIQRKVIIAPTGGALNLYPPMEGSSAEGGLKNHLYFDNRAAGIRNPVSDKPQPVVQSIFFR
jgi:hypothetical protein